MRALFVGLGGVGQRHLRNLRALLGDTVSLSAYRVRRERHVITDQLGAETDLDVEETHQIRTHETLEAALCEGPHIAIIANPTSLHLGTLRAVLEANCDVLVEKPVSNTLDGARDVCDLADTRGRIVAVGYQLRFHPLIQALERALNQEILGKLYGARVEVAEFLPGFHPYEDYRRMYASRADQGGGVVLTQIHELDLIYHLWGQPREVMSYGGRYSSLELDVEDSATSLLAYDNGTAPRTVQLHQDYLAEPPRRSMLLWGERGSLALDLRGGTLIHIQRDGQQDLLASAAQLARNELFVNEMRDFLLAVSQRTRPRVPLEVGLESVRLALAIKRSMAEGRPCLLQEIQW